MPSETLAEATDRAVLRAGDDDARLRWIEAVLDNALATDRYMREGPYDDAWRKNIVDCVHNWANPVGVRRMSRPFVKESVARLVVKRGFPWRESPPDTLGERPT
jgi:hypothetical protein